MMSMHAHHAQYYGAPYSNMARGAGGNAIGNPMYNAPLSYFPRSSHPYYPRSPAGPGMMYNAPSPYYPPSNYRYSPYQQHPAPAPAPAPAPHNQYRNNSSYPQAHDHPQDNQNDRSDDGSIREADITDNDVLFGRGGKVYKHKGNGYFRKIVAEQQPAYLRASKGDKPTIAKSIVANIRQKNGRFLKKNSDGLDKWIEADVLAVAKTLQSLREGIQRSREDGTCGLDGLARLMTIKLVRPNSLAEEDSTDAAPIFGIDVNGNVNEWNLKTAEITGYSREEAYDKPLVATFIAPKFRESMQDFLDTVLKGIETANYELEFETKSKETRVFLVDATTRRDIDNNIVGVVGVIILPGSKKRAASKKRAPKNHIASFRV
jgi:PAS domain S-box-containing protein